MKIPCEIQNTSKLGNHCIYYISHSVMLHTKNIITIGLSDFRESLLAIITGSILPHCSLNNLDKDSPKEASQSGNESQKYIQKILITKLTTHCSVLQATPIEAITIIREINIRIYLLHIFVMPTSLTCLLYYTRGNVERADTKLKGSITAQSSDYSAKQ